MTVKYKFEHDYMKFAEGGLDEKIAYDRYSTPEHDIAKINVGDTVVCKLDRKSDKREIGVVLDKSDPERVIVETRTLTGDGLVKYKKEFHHELLTKPLDLFPHDLWTRWAKAGASVESEDKKEWVENELRWLFDGFKSSPGGRIQLAAGQEFVTGEKANLSAFNCFVIPSPHYKKEDWDKAATDKEYAKLAVSAVIKNAINEAQIMARGGGVGYAATTIPPKILGANISKKDIVLYLPKTHKDYEILQDLIKLNKFDHVTIETEKEYLPTENYIIIVPEDSREGLLNSSLEMSENLYDGNKVVVDFSNIRYKGAIVKGVNGRSSGAPSWMALYDVIAELLQMDEFDCVDTMEIQSYVTSLIEQGGSRRGALMDMLDVWHPNIKKFITRKETFGKITGANVSVGTDNKFMNLVLEARKGKNSEEHKFATEVWDRIIESAWKSAEPGVIFMEFYNEESNSWYFAPIICTNPCGEQGLPAWGVCNLKHFVLSRFYDKDKNVVNWDDLARAIKIGIRFQDNMIDYTNYFIPENEEQQKSERRVGAGSMGLATLLIRLGLRYGSKESLEFIDKLYKFIAVEAYKTSIDLAIEKGKFPKCEPELMAQSGFMKRLLPELPEEYREKFFKYGIRNVTLLTQAPCGSTGTYIDNLLMNYDDGTSTGIEPYFAFKYYRASRSGFAEQEVALVKKWREENPNQELPDYFVTAQDLSPDDHIRVQAAIQKWTDSSISKTANCPEDFTIEDTKRLYELAFELGCKGVTIYRANSRQAQVLSTDKDRAKLETDIEEEKLKKLKEEELKSGTSKITNPLPVVDKTSFIKKRPKRLHGFTDKINFSYGDKFGRAYVTINLDESGYPWEVFVSTKEKEVSSVAKALGLMTTKLLRLGCTSDNLQQAIDTLTYDQTMGTMPFQIATILMQIQKENIKKQQEQSGTVKLAKCPSCGEEAYDKGNCICNACGVSKCN